MIVTFYLIYCKDPDVKEIYIGSTNDLRRRIRQHKYNCCNKSQPIYNYRVYRFIREYGGFDNWDFRILNQTDYINYDWKRTQEQCYIDCYKPYLNTARSIILSGEFEKYKSDYNRQKYIENRDEILKRVKKYAKENKEKIQDAGKKYYESKKDELILKSKEYYEKNRQDKLEYAKKYREKNKEKVAAALKKCYDAKKLETKNSEKSQE